MIAAATLAALAVVVQDQAPLRAAPREAAAPQAVLWQGDLVEVRGERLGHLQVWDHRRERAGYVKAGQLRRLVFDEAGAAELLAVLRFLRDTPGAESLGIAYVAAYLKAAPSQALDAEPFDALGTMAERLARRASGAAGPGSRSAAEHLEVATGYGVRFRSFEVEGTLRLCYDGEAFRRVLASAGAAAPLRARAALALTRPDCADPDATPKARHDTDRAHAELLDRLAGADLGALPPTLQHRLHARRAVVWSSIAFDRARNGEPAQAAAQRAIDALAAADRSELPDEDLADHTEAALRVGAMRWAAAPMRSPATRYLLHAEAREPGQTCAVLLDPRSAGAPPLARRCTFGVVWLASARLHGDGRTLVVAAQPLPGWTELWVFRAGAAPDGAWTVDVLPPAAATPGIGYTEFAGWVVGTRKLLVAREARAEGRLRRSFEVMSIDTLAVEKQAASPTQLTLFARWQDASWRSGTVSLR